MPKRAVSVTLDTDNLLWLRGRTKATGRRSLSEMLDSVITAARTNGRAPGPIRSVVGTVTINPDDPLLLKADSMIRAEFEASLRRTGAQLAGEPAHSGEVSRTRMRKARKRRG